MNINLQYFYLVLLTFTGFSIQAQEKDLSKAEKEYENYAYINAQSIYLKVAEKGFESEELFQRLGDSYYFNADYGNANTWYTKLFHLSENQDIAYLRRYAQALQASGNHKKATHYYNLFKNKYDQIRPSASVLAAEDYLKLIDKNADRYNIKKLNKINTDGIEFGHSFHNGELIYASTKDTGTFVKRKSSWDGLSFLDLYSVEVQKDSVVGTSKKLKGEVNGKFHESSAVLTSDGKTMYFTKSNVNEESNSESKQLKIYRATYVEGNWQELEDLSINDASYSTAHPALDTEERYLYYSSDRPGGFGSSDLYKVEILQNGDLGEPENLGAKINTSGKETFPFISNKNELYFSSDGHFGLGGLDIFYIKIEPAGFGDLLNIGMPINSYADDFSFGIDTDTKYGFFSTNRNTKKEFVYDNIFSLYENAEIINVYKASISGVVLEEGTEKPIYGALITLYSEDGSADPLSIKTEEDGSYHFTTNYFNSYRIQAEKEGYDTKEDYTEAKKEEQVRNFKLKPNTLALIPGNDMSIVLNIQDILFDFDESNIRSEAQLKLEKLITVMEEYPEIKIEIRSHTDSRGSEGYNNALSERRAQSTKKYLVEKGIEEDRLEAKGYGETMLLNECEDGINCSNVKHEQNRRSEFIILE